MWGFASFAFKRLVSRAGSVLLILISSALAIALTVAIPEFSNSASKRIMQEELAARVQSARGSRFAVRFSLPVRPAESLSLDDAAYDRDWIADLLGRALQLDVASAYMECTSPTLYLKTRPEDPYHDPDFVKAVKIGYVPDAAQHLQIIQGTPMDGAIPPDVLPVWIERSLASANSYIVGDRYYLSDPSSPTKSPVTLEIAGIWEYAEGSESWYGRFSPGPRNALLTTQGYYEGYVSPLRAQITERNVWHIVLDDNRLQLSQANFYLDGLAQVEREVVKRLPNATMELSPRAELESAHRRMAHLSALLFGLSLPFWASILIFILSLSSVMAHSQESEVAMLVSRGSSRWQVVWLLVTENLLTLALAMPLGIVGGLGLAQLMGNAQGFLAFTAREPLPVTLATIPWGLAILAGLITVVMRMVPLMLATRVSIVSYERAAARRSLGMTAALALTILLLVAATAYTYWRLQEIGTTSLLAWRPESEQVNDPLLVVAPALFLLTSSLLVAQLFGILMIPLARLAHFMRSSLAYLGILNLSREGNLYRLPTFLLVLCLGFGSFYVSVAKSADIWLVDRLRYQVGADLTFQNGNEAAASGTEADAISGLERGSQELGAWVLPISEYEAIPGVLHASPVGDYKGTLLTTTRMAEVRLLAVDRMTFPNVAYHRRDLAPNPLGEMMNRLGAHPDGIIVPAELLQRLQLGPGDRLSVRVWLGKYDQVFDFQVVDSFTYFPTMYPNDSLALVANLEYLQSQTSGSFTYGMWMRLEPGASAEGILSRVKQLGVTVLQPRDLRTIVAEDRRSLERVGVFGILSTCFVGVAFLACIGFLVVGFHSITSRVVRFGMLQALGMMRREVAGSVVLELALTLAFGIALGSLFGVVAARLYVPHLALITDTDVAIPPFIPFMDWQRTAWLGGVMFIILLIAEGALLVRVMRAQVFALLRLGLRP